MIRLLPGNLCVDNRSFLFSRHKERAIQPVRVGSSHKQHGQRGILQCWIIHLLSRSLWAFYLPLCAPLLPPDYSSVMSWRQHLSQRQLFPLCPLSLQPGFRPEGGSRCCSGQFQWNLEGKELQHCLESSSTKPARLCSHSWLFPTHPNTCH